MKYIHGSHAGVRTQLLVNAERKAVVDLTTTVCATPTACSCWYSTGGSSNSQCRRTEQLSVSKSQPHSHAAQKNATHRAPNTSACAPLCARQAVGRYKPPSHRQHSCVKPCGQLCPNQTAAQLCGYSLERRSSEASEVSLPVGTERCAACDDVNRGVEKSAAG